MSLDDLMGVPKKPADGATGDAAAAPVAAPVLSMAERMKMMREKRDPVAEAAAKKAAAPPKPKKDKEKDKAG